jgi:hypothetical protein
MSTPSHHQDDRAASPVYRIRVAGHLGSRFRGRFDGMTISHEDDGTTLLTGAIVDQPALHGLLRKVRDLGLTLISVVRIGSEVPGSEVPKEPERPP